MICKQIFPDRDGYPNAGTIIAIYNYDNRMCITEFIVRNNRAYYYYYKVIEKKEFSSSFALDELEYLHRHSAYFIHNT